MISKNFLENGTIDAVYQNESTMGVVDKRYNGQLIFNATNSVSLGINNLLTLKVNVNNLDKFNRLNSVKLSILANVMRYDKPIKLSLETSLRSNTGNYIEEFVLGSNDRYEVDITKYIVGKEEQTFYFGISSEGNYPVYLTSYDAPYLTINYKESANLLSHRNMLEGSVGDKISYGVDIRNGALLINKRLYQLDGCLMPINLSLVYSNFNSGITVEEGLPLGWKFNYFQKLSESTNKIIYLDSEGIEHEFIVSNVNDKYFDRSGTGLILTKGSDGTYQITNGYNDYLFFNSNGYLTAIRKKIGNNYLTTTLGYDSSNRLTTISDPMGNIVTLTYIGTTSVGISCTNNLSILVSFSDNKLIRVNEQPGRITEFSYTDSTTNAIITKIEDDNGNRAELLFDERYRVLEVVDSVYKDEVNALLEKRTFDYGLTSTKVTNLHDVKMVYTFDEEGQVKSVSNDMEQFEISLSVVEDGEKKQYLKTNSYDRYILDSKTLNEGGAETEYLASTFTELVDNLVFEANQEYVVCFAYLPEGCYTTDKDGRGAGIMVKQGGQTLALGAIDFKNNNESTTGFTFKTISNEKPTFIAVMADNKGKVKFSEVIVCKYIKQETSVCYNYGEEGVEAINCEGESFYPRTQPFTLISYFDISTNQSVMKEVKLYSEDMMENIKNCALANGNGFDLWYNHKRSLISNVKNVKVFLDDGYGDNIQNYKLCILTETNTEKVFNYYDYTNSSSVTNILRTEIEKIYFENIYYENQQIVSRDYLPLEVETYDNIKITYQYDMYGNIINEARGTHSIENKIQKRYEYSSDKKRLTKEITTSANLEDAVVEYVYNDRGLISKVIMPNGLEYNYTYDTNTLELIKISCSDSPVLTENNMTYLKGLITNVSHKGNIGYDYSYDKYNMISAVKTNYSGVINNFITMNSEVTPSQDVFIIQYPSGYRVKAITDKYGNVIEQSHSNDGVNFETDKTYFYAGYKVENVDHITDPNSESLHKHTNSKLRKIVDNSTDDITRIEYNVEGEVVKVTHTNDSYVKKISYERDEQKRLIHTSASGTPLNIKETQDYRYRNNSFSPSQDLEGIDIELCDLDDNVIANYSYSNSLDELNRVYKESSVFELYRFDKTLTYESLNNITTMIPKNVSYRKINNYTETNMELLGDIEYEYNNMNNITNITDTFSGNNTSYEYDLFGRLTRENNQKLGKSVKYTYDDKGNITKIEEGNYTLGDITIYRTTNYSYSSTHPDRVVSYGGQGITYDLNGNITNLGVKALTWTKNKQLSQVQRNDVNTLTYAYTYDADGRRLTKTGPQQESHQYVYNGNKLVGELAYSTSTGTNNLVYIYSGNEIIGLRCNEDNYLFIKNNQHDIIGIVNSSGNIVAKYVYDAWGNHFVCNSNGTTNTNASFIGNINPFRYRGYYYDVETGFYWVSSRYYSPEICRWLSPDSIEYLNPGSIDGLNLYAYCNNNPVNMYDPTGHVAVSTLLIISAIITGVCVVGGAVIGGVSAGMSSEDVGDVFAGIGKGALNGLILGGGISLAVCGFGFGATTTLGSIMACYGLSISANMLEVAITQGKKSYYDGDSFWSGANDINNAMFANSGNILIGKPTLMSIPFYGTRITSKIPTIFNVLVSYEIDNLFGSMTFLASAKATLLTKTISFGKVAGYVLTAVQCFELIKSIFNTPDFENSRWILY